MQDTAATLGLRLAYDVKPSGSGALDRLTITVAKPSDLPAGTVPARIEQVIGSTGSVRALSRENLVAMLKKARVHLGLES
jgi:hypothetical protein